MLISQYPFQSEMFAVFAAILLSPFVPAMHIALLRISKRSDLAVKFMMFSFAVYGTLWIIISWYLNYHEYDTITTLVAGYSTIGFMCLGYAEAFSMLCRGFSLHIITDIYFHGSLTLPEIMESYGGGTGAKWLLKKRIKTMEGFDIVKWDKGILIIKGRKARLAGKLGLLVKKMLNMGAGA